MQGMVNGQRQGLAWGDARRLRRPRVHESSLLSGYQCVPRASRWMQFVLAIFEKTHRSLPQPSCTRFCSRHLNHSAVVLPSPNTTDRSVPLAPAIYRQTMRQLGSTENNRSTYPNAHQIDHGLTSYPRFTRCILWRRQFNFVGARRGDVLSKFNASSFLYLAANLKSHATQKQRDLGTNGPTHSNAL